MRNTPLHESHLLEAVRRKIVTSDPMEQVLALARSLPPDGAVAYANGRRLPLLFSAAVQLIRTRDLRAGAAATEAPSVWG
jgi:hypothetical protein